MSEILETATTTHAAHLTRHHCSPLLALSRISIFPSNPPTLTESPVALRVPLPAQKSCLVISISAQTGLIEIEDEGAIVSYDSVGRGMEDRGKRAKMACASVNEGKTRLGDDIGRLITAVRPPCDWANVDHRGEYRKSNENLRVYTYKKTCPPISR